METYHGRDEKTTQWGYDKLCAEIKTVDITISDKMYKKFCNGELTSPFLLLYYYLLRMANY